MAQIRKGQTSHKLMNATVFLNTRKNALQTQLLIWKVITQINKNVGRLSTMIKQKLCVLTGFISLTTLYEQSSTTHAKYTTCVKTIVDVVTGYGETIPTRKWTVSLCTAVFLYMRNQ